MNNRIIRGFLCVMLAGLLSKNVFVITACATEQTSYGSAGIITEAERNPEEGDHSNWLTIQAGDIGVRIVSDDNKELVAVDNYGGIYLNGDVYLNGDHLDEIVSSSEVNVASTPNVANGFFYLLLVVSLVCNCYNGIRVKKLEKHRGATD